MKNLLDTLKEMKRTELVYVATQKGSSYICIDEASKLIETIEEVNSKLYDRTFKQISSGQDELDWAFNRLVELRKINDPDEETLARILDNEKQFATAFGKREKGKRDVLKWVDIMKRPVVDTYKRDVYGVGTVLIIKGSENGTLWWKGENEKEKEKEE